MGVKELKQSNKQNKHMRQRNLREKDSDVKIVNARGHQAQHHKDLHRVSRLLKQHSVQRHERMLEAPKPPGSFLSGFLFPMLYTDSLARASRRVVRTAYNVSMPSPLVSTSMGTFIHLLALRATSPTLVISCNHHSSAAVSHLISSPLSSPNTDSAAGEQVVCS